MKPQTLSSKPVFEGRIFDIRIDEIREGDLEYSREVVVHKGSAVIVPVFRRMGRSRWCGSIGMRRVITCLRYLPGRLMRAKIR